MATNNNNASEQNIDINNAPLLNGKRAREGKLCVQHNVSLMENAPKTPRLSDSPFRMLQIIDTRLEKQTEKIKELFAESEVRLLHEIDLRMGDLRQEVNIINERVNKLEALTNDIVVCSLSDVKNDLTSVVDRVAKLETDFVRPNNVAISDDLMDEMANLRSKIAQQENAAVSCDLRINNIPHLNNENLFDMFNYLCQQLNIPTPNVNQIYRLKSKNKTPAPTILVKLSTPYEKNYV